MLLFGNDLCLVNDDGYSRMCSALRLSAQATLALLLVSCASPPPVHAPPLVQEPPPEPLVLAVRDLRAAPRGLKTAAVSFVIDVANPGAFPAEWERLGWTFSIDGAVLEEGSVLGGGPIGPGGMESREVLLDAAIPEAASGYATFSVSASAARRVPGGAPLVSSAEASLRFPVIREPRFSVRSIKIKKAELINTKFEVVLRAENPNAVPLRLNRIEYELFGERRLWTDGIVAETIPVPAGGMVDKKLTLQMNFINMKRDLLDQVIKLQVVDYRFKGIAGIGTDLPEYPSFSVPYDLQGRTSVTE